MHALTAHHKCFKNVFFLYYHLIKRYYFLYWRINTEIEQNVDIYGLCCKKNPVDNTSPTMYSTHAPDVV